MNPIQILALIIGGLFVLSYFFNFKEFFDNMLSAKQKESQEEAIQIPEVAVSGIRTASLSDIVYQWEKLRNMCRNHQLKDADQKLEELFPLLVKKDTGNERL